MENFTIKFLINETHETAVEEYRNGKGINEVYFKDEKPCGIPIEFADVLLRVFDTCGHLGINLETALELKMEYNKKRPHRHGGKRL